MKPMSFREAIIRELKRRDWSAYRLGKKAHVPIRSVQAYLAGRCDMAGENVAKLCAALGLKLVATSERKAK